MSLSNLANKIVICLYSSVRPNFDVVVSTAVTHRLLRKVYGACQTELYELDVIRQQVAVKKRRVVDLLLLKRADQKLSDQTC